MEKMYNSINHFCNDIKKLIAAEPEKVENKELIFKVKSPSKVSKIVKVEDVSAFMDWVEKEAKVEIKSKNGFSFFTFDLDLELTFLEISALHDLFYTYAKLRAKRVSTFTYKVKKLILEKT